MLTDGDINDFHTHGYLVVENALEPKRLSAVQHEYRELLNALYRGWEREGRVPPDSGLTFWEKLERSYEAGFDWFQPMDISLPGGRIHADTPMHFGPAVFAMIISPRVLDIVEALIGGEITSNPIQHVRIKPPSPQLHAGEARAHITATDWHQDRGVAHAEADNTDMVTVWVAVTDATIDNGCLQVVPKHTDELLPHCPKSQLALADGTIDEARAVPLPVKAGGAVLFHPLTPHASRVNTTQGFRWSFDLRYNVTGQPTGRAHFPSFVARSRADPGRELRDWRVWRRSWEEARSRLARADHIDLHRWRADAPLCA